MLDYDLTRAEQVRRTDLAQKARRMILSHMKVEAEDETSLTLDHRGYYIQRKLDAAEAQRKEIISSAEEEANRIVREGENKARAIVEAAERQSSEKWDCFEKRARELIATHTELQRLIKRGG